jgi:hypothetical protein
MALSSQSGTKNLTCPHCQCIASDIIHHQPIRLDNGVKYHGISQEVLRRSEGHFCSICHTQCSLRDTVLGTFDTTKPCTHIFCYECLSELKHRSIVSNTILLCPNCRCVAVDIIPHEKWPSIEVEIITDKPTNCCDSAMDTTSYTGIGNQHEERCICHSFCRKLINCHHEGCKKRVHRPCQEDWLQRHCYPWTPEDQLFCREHTEHYVKWVRFKAGEIPRSQNGCVEGSFLNPR